MEICQRPTVYSAHIPKRKMCPCPRVRFAPRTVTQQHPSVLAPPIRITAPPIRITPPPGRMRSCGALPAKKLRIPQAAASVRRQREGRTRLTSLVCDGACSGHHAVSKAARSGPLAAAAPQEVARARNFFVPAGPWARALGDSPVTMLRILV